MPARDCKELVVGFLLGLTNGGAYPVQDGMLLAGLVAEGVGVEDDLAQKTLAELELEGYVHVINGYLMAFGEPQETAILPSMTACGGMRTMRARPPYSLGSVLIQGRRRPISERWQVRP